MSARVQDAVADLMGRLRHEPLTQRVRGVLGGRTVLDTTGAVLVWEPGRVVPTYAVPVADLAVPLEDAPAPARAGAVPPVLHPGVPFAVRTTPGRPVLLRSGTSVAEGFLPADPDLAGLVVLDFAAFEHWREEDRAVVSHPHDPFSRIDVLPSTRHLQVWLDGELLAESSRAQVLLETGLPPRHYLRREDVRCELVPSATRTTCAYKGEAAYCSVRLGDRLVEDLVWTYPAPLHDAAPVGGLVCFFDEKVDVVVDGQPRRRPVTPWS